MTRKTFMAIHTFHSSEAKQAFFGGMPESTTTDLEWAESWTFEKCKCIATWAGPDDFFFCHWEADDPQDVLDTLTEKGLDDYIFTALYKTLMHIDQNNLNNRMPFKDMAGWDQ